MGILLSLALFAIYFSMIAIIGFICLRKIINDEQDILILLPVSVTLGVTLFLFLLNIAIHFLPFSMANHTILLILFLSLVSVNRSGLGQELRTITFGLVDKQRKIYLALVIFFALVFSVLLIGTFNYDNAWHATLSMSLLNGNIPLKWPWYPDYYLGYHYAVDLLKASTQDFCGINQFYSEKPWQIFFLVGCFSFLVGISNKLKHTNSSLLFYPALCFLLLSIIPVQAVVTMLEQTSIALKTGAYRNLYDIFSNFYGENPHAAPYWHASLHKPSMLKFPMFLSILYLAICGHRHSRNKIWYALLIVLQVGFLALSEITAFAILIITLGIFFLRQIIALESNRSRWALIRQCMIIFAVALAIAFFQGGVLTTKFFFADQQFHPDSYVAAHNGFGGIQVHLNMLEALQNSEYIRKNWIIMILIFVSFVYISRYNRKFSPLIRDLVLGLSIAFIVGVILGALLWLPVKESEVDRFFLWPIGFIFIGFAWALFISNLSYQRIARTVYIHMIFVAIITIPSFAQITSGSVVSLGYQFSNAKKRTAIDTEFGMWLKENLPSNVRTFGFDPRYTGLFSWGGNVWRDSWMMVDFADFETANDSINYNYLKKHRITHLIIDAKKEYSGVLILHDNKNFSEIETPFSARWRIFAVK